MENGDSELVRKTPDFALPSFSAKIFVSLYSFERDSESIFLPALRGDVVEFLKKLVEVRTAVLPGLESWLLDNPICFSDILSYLAFELFLVLGKEELDC